MAMKCAVWNCLNDCATASSITFFMFPKKEEYHERWLKFCRCSSTGFDRNTWRVCMEHFKKEDIVEINKKRMLRLGAIPCIYKNEHSISANQKGKLKTNKPKSPRSEAPAVNDINAGDDLQTPYVLEIDQLHEEDYPSINIKHENDDDPFCHNITNTSGDLLQTEVDIKYEHEVDDTEENNAFTTKTNVYIVSSEGYGGTDEAYIVNELGYQDSCSSEASGSGENKNNGTSLKRKLASTEESSFSKKHIATTNRSQFKKLVSLLAERPDIVVGFRKISRENIQQFWDDAAKQLNDLGPPIKDSTTWKKVWLDYKSYIKRKHSTAKASGEGGRRMYTFNDLEETVIRICGFEASTSPAQEEPTGHCSTVREENIPSKLKTPISAVISYSSMKSVPANDIPSNSIKGISSSKDYNSRGMAVDPIDANESNSNPANGFQFSRTPQNFREVFVPPQQQQQPKHDTTTRTLLQKQISIQQHFYKKSTELSKRNSQTLDEIATNLDTLSKANESFAQTQADMLEEMRRHNRVMEELKREQIDKMVMLNRHNS